ncbi:MAG: DUF61 family protein, partial [Desulfobacterales bacterium]|nr:DUF61 family protein [Desulfobacterales bacterium]
MVGRNGSTHSLDPAELERIAALVPEYEWNRLLLPIIIELTPDFGASAARIRGEVECSLVIKLLELKKSADKLIAANCHAIRILRQLMSLSDGFDTRYFLMLRQRQEKRKSTPLTV